MRRYRIRPPRLRMAVKFSLVLILLAISLVMTAGFGAVAQSRMKAEAQRQYSENIVNLHRVSVLGTALAEMGWTALEMISITDETRLEPLRDHLSDDHVSDLDRQVADLNRDTESDEEGQFARQMADKWNALKAILMSPAFQEAVTRHTALRDDQRLTDELIVALNAASTVMTDMNATMAAEARQAQLTIDDEYQRTRHELTYLVAGALLAGFGSVLLLTRNLVPRIGAYSRFAAEVAAGQLSARLSPTGSDELSDLGRALNHMVERRAADEEYADTQAALTAALQVAVSESEAHLLLKRHLERCVPGSRAVVLNRNNSANRLQPMTVVAEDSGLAERLVAATPQACLAVRHARPHASTAGRESLVLCSICADGAASSRCEPLIVGGEVIGSVLVQRSELSDQDERCVRDSVRHAAPALGNMRNLALAEHRALTDALTGLPNQRASHETILRLTAHAGRTLDPLAVVLLDLDHFKQINDLYGHDKGDEVLAGVGATLAGVLRTGDFAGRYGGEEFLLLLPDTGSAEAMTIAERVRVTLSALTFAGIQRQVTASFGIAVLPDHAGDAATLLRTADAALYAAKAAGRDCSRVAADVSVGTAGAPEDERPEL